MIVYSIFVCSLVAFAASQNVKSWKDASIVNEARYLGGNGQFGAAFTQDDGVQFKEEADDYGNRKGTYSYVDPSGVRRTVTYTAGKDGFKASGDHIPSGGEAAAPAAVPVSNYVSSGNGRSNGPPLDSGFYNPDFDYPDDSKNADNGQYVPESQPSYNNAPQQSYNSVPQQSYTGYNAQQQQQQSLASYYRAAPQVQTQTQQPSYTAQFQLPQAAYNTYSTSAPSNFASFNQINTEAPTWNSRSAQSYPGKLSLNRSPDGYSYTFSTT